MSARQQIQELKNRQTKVGDSGIRLYYDGAIRTRMMKGWYVEAGSVSGASLLVGDLFTQESDEGRFLNVESLRPALVLRDAILSEAVESRVRRKVENEKDPSQPSGDFPITL